MLNLVADGAPYKVTAFPDDPGERTDSVMSRSKARELLGLPADAVVLFTVAMPHKYVLFSWVRFTCANASLGIARRGEMKIAVVGAHADGGAHLVLDLVADGAPYEVIAFLDDDPELWGTSVCGIPVLGSSADAARAVDCGS